MQTRSIQVRSSGRKVNLVSEKFTFQNIETTTSTQSLYKKYISHIQFRMFLGGLHDRITVVLGSSSSANSIINIWKKRRLIQRRIHQSWSYSTLLEFVFRAPTQISETRSHTQIMNFFHAASILLFNILYCKSFYISRKQVNDPN